MLLEYLGHKVPMVLWGLQANKVRKVFLAQLVHKVLWVQGVPVVLQAQ